MSGPASGSSVARREFNRLRHTYDDFAVGDEVVTAGRTVDIDDVKTFAGLTGDRYPHTDEEYCRTTPFGGRIGHGPPTYGFAVGLVALSGFLGDAIRVRASVARETPTRPHQIGE